MAEEQRQQKKRGVSFREPEKSLAALNVRSIEEASASKKHRPAILRGRAEKRMREDDELLVVKRSTEKPTEKLPIPCLRPAALTSSPSHADRHKGRIKRRDLQSFAWPKINLTLSLKEKEEYFLIMKGTKLPRRPNKRPKNVERALQISTPGNWLPEIKRARYEVKEKQSNKKKRPRGLKGIQSMASDSD